MANPDMYVTDAQLSIMKDDMERTMLHKKEKEERRRRYDMRKYNRTEQASSLGGNKTDTLVDSMLDDFKTKLHISTVVADHQPVDNSNGQGTTGTTPGPDPPDTSVSTKELGELDIEALKEQLGEIAGCMENAPDNMPSDTTVVNSTLEPVQGTLVDPGADVIGQRPSSSTPLVPGHSPSTKHDVDVDRVPERSGSGSPLYHGAATPIDISHDPVSKGTLTHADTNQPAGYITSPTPNKPHNNNTRPISKEISTHADTDQPKGSVPNPTAKEPHVSTVLNAPSYVSNFEPRSTAFQKYDHDRMASGKGPDAGRIDRMSRAVERDVVDMPDFKQEFEKYVEDDVDYRIRGMKEIGINPSEGFDLNLAGKRRKEMEHWRMKLTLEEKELAENCSTFIAVGADLLEGLCGAINFHAFETKHLSREMDSAIKEGRFSSCIRQYANMGGTQWLKNPLMNFVTTFCSVALKNHLGQKKNKVMGAYNKRKNRTKKKAPSSLYNNRARRVSDSDSGDESDFPRGGNNRKRSRHKRREYRRSSHGCTAQHPHPQQPYPHPHPQQQPYPHMYSHPHPYPPPHSYQHQYQYPHPYQQQPPPHHDPQYVQSPHQMSPHAPSHGHPRSEVEDRKSSGPIPLEPKPRVRRNVDEADQAPSYHIGQASTRDDKHADMGEIVRDRKTGGTRVLMSEVASTLPIGDITKTVSKFAPVLGRVKKRLETSHEIEAEKNKLDALEHPVGLFK